MEDWELVRHLEAVPYWKLLGMKVRRIEPGFAELALPFKGELAQLFAVMHGGAIASLMDAAGAVSFFKLLDLERETVTTAEMKLNYLKPVTADGREITAAARVIKKGKTLGVSLVEIKNDAGEAVALGIATFAIVPRRY